MRVNSLALRLTFSAAVVSVVLLAATALLLANLFQQALERNFDARLRAVLDGLAANVELAPDGSPVLRNQLADTRFQVADSGWYWQVIPPEPAQKLLKSDSVLSPILGLDDELLSNRDEEMIASFSMDDVFGSANSGNRRLRAVEQRLKLFDQPHEYSFLVAGNFDELRAEVQSFRQALYITLGVLGAGLLLASILQVRYGLQPMKLMERKLNDIRSGKIEMLEGNFPSEMQPVADELNLLVQSNFEIIDRARMQVGNLAHALKTPISVLTNEARDTPGPLADKVKEQVGIMRDQVNLYLDRARRAARAQTIGAATEVEPTLQSLARTLKRINQDRGIEITVNAPAGLKFRGERQDLEEIVGNLMDNACKWSKGRVEARAGLLTMSGEDGRPWLLIEVDDDGPGIPAAKRANALRRGQRLDETKPGSGLGLNIVTETAAMYGGGVELDEAALGGLKVRLRLPAIA